MASSASCDIKPSGATSWYYNRSGTGDPSGVGQPSEALGLQLCGRAALPTEVASVPPLAAGDSTPLGTPSWDYNRSGTGDPSGVGRPSEALGAVLSLVVDFLIWHVAFAGAFIAALVPTLGKVLNHFFVSFLYRLYFLVQIGGRTALWRPAAFLWTGPAVWVFRIYVTLVGTGRSAPRSVARSWRLLRTGALCALGGLPRGRIARLVRATAFVGTSLAAATWLCMRFVSFILIVALRALLGCIAYLLIATACLVVALAIGAWASFYLSLFNGVACIGAVTWLLISFFHLVRLS